MRVEVKPRGELSGPRRNQRLKCCTELRIKIGPRLKIKNVWKGRNIYEASVLWLLLVQEKIFKFDWFDCRSCNLPG